jgi:hypothetical protein
MPQHQVRAPYVRAIEPFSRPIEDLKKQGIADLLARQQEEYEEFLVDRTANETPRYLIRLRAAQQAAQNAICSTTDEYSYCSKIGVAVAVAFSILLFLKLRYG